MIPGIIKAIPPHLLKEVEANYAKYGFYDIDHFISASIRKALLRRAAKTHENQIKVNFYLLSPLLDPYTTHTLGLTFINYLLASYGYGSAEDFIPDAVEDLLVEWRGEKNGSV